MGPRARWIGCGGPPDSPYNSHHRHRKRWSCVGIARRRVMLIDIIIWLATPATNSSRCQIARMFTCLGSLQVNCAAVIPTRTGWHGTQTTAVAFCNGVLSESTEVTMHSKLLAIAGAGVLMMAGTAAWGQSSTAEKTPGHIMQRTPQAKSTGPGASEYAPGHLKRKSKSQSASQFTPSHRTTPTTTGMRTR
jgi:hypothetical protein